MIPAAAPVPGCTGGRLVSQDGRPLPLRATSIRVDARGGLARVAIEQRFENTHAETLAVSYRMPLPADGAVSGYAFRIGERRIVGEVDRRSAARERFEQAIVDGRRAALVEQERSSLFTQEIHGIPPGAELVAELVVDQRLAWLDEGAWEWRFPTAAAPRYLGSPGSVTDAESVNLDVADAPLPARFSLVLSVRDVLAPGRNPESPSHPLSFTAQRVTLAAGEAPLDRDVVVRWAVARPAAGVTLDVARPATPRGEQRDAAHALLTLVPPLPERRPLPVPRDLVLLLDRSGSMRGSPLLQAQRVCAALVDGLGEADRLEVVAFAVGAERWRPEPTPATPEARREALAWIAERDAAGGTEMRTGILEALATSRTDAQRQVVVVSDGLIGFEQETVSDILARLPPESRLHTVGVGSAPNRSFTAAAARAGRGVEVIIGPGEDAERAARQILARTRAPLIVDLVIEGSALEACVPERLPDLFAGAPALVAARLRAEGGELVVRGRTADGRWEQRVLVPRTEPGEGSPTVTALFGRESVEDAEMRLCAGGSPREIDPLVERLGLDFQIATRLTSWVAVDAEPAVDPGAPLRAVRVPQQLAHGLSAEGLGLRAPAAVRARTPTVTMPRVGLGPAHPAHPSSGPLPQEGSQARPGPRAPAEPRPSGGAPSHDFDEKTRVTQVVQPPPAPGTARSTTDCLVVIYTKEPTLLGKRFVLEQSPTRIGRGADNHIVLDGDSVSRRHAHFEQRRREWLAVDDGSTNGTYANDEAIPREVPLKNGDRVKIGQTIFKFLSGADVEAQYHEEIYRMTIMDGLTQIHNKRYLLEALDRELVRARRHERDFSLLIFDIDHFKRINDTHGHLAGDFVLRELARVVDSRRRRDEVFARYGGEEFALVLPETSLEGAVALAEAVRERVAEHLFRFQSDTIRVTVSVGAAVLVEGDQKAADLIKRADERLYAAKNGGRNRVCS
jgi:Ca-activated chloride channel family protein